MPSLPSASRGTTSAYAHLTILSDSLSPQELEEGVGLRPDTSWAKGEPMRGGRDRTFNGIEYRSTLDREQEDPGDHVEDLAERLRPYADRIRILAEDERVHSAKVWLYCQTSGENPAFELAQATLEVLSRSGATLAIDFYFGEDD